MSSKHMHLCLAHLQDALKHLALHLSVPAPKGTEVEPPVIQPSSWEPASPPTKPAPAPVDEGEPVSKAPHDRKLRRRRRSEAPIQGASEAVISYLEMARTEEQYWVEVGEIASGIYPTEHMYRIFPRLKYLLRKGKIIAVHPGEANRFSYKSKVYLDR